MTNEQLPAPSTPFFSCRLPTLRRCGAFASAGLAVMLVLGACGDDSGSTTATDSTDSSEIQDDASGLNETDGNNADNTADNTAEPDLDEDPANAADGDDMTVDEPGLGDGGQDGIDPAAGGSTFNPVGGSWILQSLTIEGDMAIPLEEGSPPTIEVLGTELRGFSGCNSFGASASYDIEGDSFSAQLNEITEIGCGTDTEMWFLQALGSVNSFTSEPGVLTLTDNAEFPTTMRFIVDAAPEDPASETEDPDDPDGVVTSPINLDDADFEEIAVPDPADDAGAPAENYVGLSLEEAEALAEANGHKIRIMEQDGEQFAGTMEVDMSRVNVGITDGIITEAFTG